MNYSTTETYQMKREILDYSKKISCGLSKDLIKFTQDMIYGISASSSCNLSSIADKLMESIKKKNTVERLSRKLSGGVSKTAYRNYLERMRPLIDKNGVVFVDESEVIKPYGKKFEALGLVKDGSSKEKKIEKGYHITELTALTKTTHQPISLFSNIHSSKEEGFVSVNDVTFKALSLSFKLLPNATYVFDRGYDMNKLFTFMYKNKKQFIVRIKENRLIEFNKKWNNAGELRDSHKGKIASNVMFNGNPTDCKITCMNVRITESRKKVKLVIIYGLAEKPMMLLTNRHIEVKDDVIRVVRAYFSRWRIEEYFRFKKQHYKFEDFRVRSLVSINALNFFLTCAIGFLGIMAEKKAFNTLRQAILDKANALREDVSFLFYRFGKGIARILDYAHTGIRRWQNIRKTQTLLYAELLI